MKKIIMVLVVSLMTINAHAGWIIAGDSSDYGVIKVSRNSNNDMDVEVCRYIYEENCKPYSEIGTLEEIYETTENITQTAMAGFAHAFMGLVAVIVPEAIALGPAIGAAGFAIGGEIILTKLKSANIIRHADFVKIYKNSFIDSENDIISFPDDTLSEILSEL